MFRHLEPLSESTSSVGQDVQNYQVDLACCVQEKKSERGSGANALCTSACVAYRVSGTAVCGIRCVARWNPMSIALPIHGCWYWRGFMLSGCLRLGP